MHSGTVLQRSLRFDSCSFAPSQSRRPYTRSRTVVTAAQQTLQAFPQNYVQVVRDAREATQAAIADGHKLIEVEFPTYSLAAVAGDDDGCAEFNASLNHLRTFCQVFQQQAAKTRILFPDESELRVAVQGKSMDPNSGSAALEPVFDQTNFQLSALTNPNFLSDAGIIIGQPKVLEQIQRSDELYICAYPHFNVGEIIAIAELYEGAAKEMGTPVVVFNGELDRVRSGYYPSFLYPKIGRLAKTFLPAFEAALYIHNFKGSRGGALFRCYPGPWQVLRRYSEDDLRLVHTQDTMPTLKQVAVEILPNA